jgi:porphobilinogen synthase
MPGHYQLSIDLLEQEIANIKALDISGVILFGISKTKDSTGSAGSDPQGPIPQAISRIKQLAPQLLVISDLCLCEYTDHGHCGVLDHKGDVDNDATLIKLQEQAVSHAKAGVDLVAPSSNADGMVRAIRQALDSYSYEQMPVLSYSVKYASKFYGPFREAAQGAPQFGDRKRYQMNPANRELALSEARLDVDEGADMLLVKPAGYYLDIIADIKQRFHKPLGAYQVSGEYSMIKAAHEKGWLDGSSVAYESLLSLKRAGADFIITYFAKEVASELIKSSYYG